LVIVSYKAYKVTSFKEIEEIQKEKLMLNEALNEIQITSTNGKNRVEMVKAQERRMRRQRRHARSERRFNDGWSVRMF